MDTKYYDSIIVTLQSRILCKKCNYVLMSYSRHDYIKCKCGACFLDGGLDYVRIGGDLNAVTDMSVRSPLTAIPLSYLCGDEEKLKNGTPDDPKLSLETVSKYIEWMEHSRPKEELESNLLYRHLKGFIERNFEW